MKRLCCAWMILIATLAHPGQARFSDAGKKPNIVFILVENLGYGELGVYGGGILRGAPTPHTPKSQK